MYLYRFKYRIKGYKIKWIKTQCICFYAIKTEDNNWWRYNQSNLFSLQQPKSSKSCRPVPHFKLNIVNQRYKNVDDQLVKLVYTFPKEHNSFLKTSKYLQLRRVYMCIGKHFTLENIEQWCDIWIHVIDQMWILILNIHI